MTEDTTNQLSSEEYLRAGLKRIARGECAEARSEAAQTLANESAHASLATEVERLRETAQRYLEHHEHCDVSSYYGVRERSALSRSRDLTAELRRYFESGTFSKESDLYLLLEEVEALQANGKAGTADASSSLKTVRAGFDAAEQALTDWLRTYATDFFDPELIKAAQERIGEYGTIGYIAEANNKIRGAVVALNEMTRAYERAPSRTVYDRRADRIRELTEVLGELYRDWLSKSYSGDGSSLGQKVRSALRIDKPQS